MLYNHRNLPRRASFALCTAASVLCSQKDAKFNGEKNLNCFEISSLNLPQLCQQLLVCFFSGGCCFFPLADCHKRRDELVATLPWRLIAAANATTTLAVAKAACMGSGASSAANATTTVAVAKAAMRFKRGKNSPAGSKPATTIKDIMSKKSQNKENPPESTSVPSSAVANTPKADIPISSETIAGTSRRVFDVGFAQPIQNSTLNMEKNMTHISAGTQPIESQPSVTSTPNVAKNLMPLFGGTQTTTTLPPVQLAHSQNIEHGTFQASSSNVELMIRAYMGHQTTEQPFEDVLTSAERKLSIVARSNVHRAHLIVQTILERECQVGSSQHQHSDSDIASILKLTVDKSAANIEAKVRARALQKMSIRSARRKKSKKARWKKDLESGKTTE